MTQIEISIERKLITYSDFWHAGGSLLEQGKKERKGSYFQFLGSIMFFAFCFEAFLNHLGEHLFDCWPEIERKLSPRGKLGLICEKIQVTPEFGKLPWQILPELLGVRDKVAHGKNETLRQKQTVSEGQYDQMMYEFLIADWQKAATSRNVTKIQKNLGELLQLLHTAAQIKDDRLFGFGAQYRRASAVKN